MFQNKCKFSDLGLFEQELEAEEAEDRRRAEERVREEEARARRKAAADKLRRGAAGGGGGLDFGTYAHQGLKGREGSGSGRVRAG